MLFQEPSQRAIIDNGGANGFQSSGAFQSFCSHKHAAPRCAGGRATGSANPGWRVKHEKEIHKSGNEQFFREALTMQLHHKRDQIVMTMRGNETQIRYGLRTVEYVSVRQHEPCGI